MRQTETKVTGHSWTKEEKIRQRPRTPCTFKHVRKGERERHDERGNGQKRRRETRRKRETLEEFKG